MAIVSAPLFSFSANGQIGKSIVYSNWKGINYVKKYSVPTNPNSASQQVFRGYFKTAVDAWKAEASSVKKAWTDFAGNNNMQMSGYNLYISKYTEFMANSSGTPPTVTNTPPDMS